MPPSWARVGSVCQLEDAGLGDVLSKAGSGFLGGHLHQEQWVSDDESPKTSFPDIAHPAGLHGYIDRQISASLGVL